LILGYFQREPDDGLSAETCSFLITVIKHVDIVVFDYFFLLCLVLIPLLLVKIIQLVDRTDLFKIGNLVYCGRENVTSLYSSLEGQRQTVYGWCSELAATETDSVWLV
jgi:hypothetical protein